jgi:hypothetical protein
MGNSDVTKRDGPVCDCCSRFGGAMITSEVNSLYYCVAKTRIRQANVNFLNVRNVQ